MVNCESCQMRSLKECERCATNFLMENKCTPEGAPVQVEPFDARNRLRFDPNMFVSNRKRRQLNPS